MMKCKKSSNQDDDSDTSLLPWSRAYSGVLRRVAQCESTTLRRLTGELHVARCLEDMREKNAQWIHSGTAALERLARTLTTLLAFFYSVSREVKFKILATR